MNVFIRTFIGGLNLGAIYALIALGYSMVYGIAKMLNFAHGDVIMIGAYAGIVCVSSIGLPPLLAILLSCIICAILGMLIEVLAYKPLRKASSLAVLITAIGVSYFLQNIALLFFGSQQKAYPSIGDFGSIQVAGVKVDGISILTIVVTAVIMIALTLFVNKTKLGKAMKATSEDRGAAELMGISSDKTILLTFGIGSFLAAIASTFYGATFIYVKPTTGSMPGIKAFTAAVFGGIGSLPGAMLGGLLIGMIEQFSQVYISTLWSDAITFAVLIIVLLVKPSGLLGKTVVEKV